MKRFLIVELLVRMPIARRAAYRASVESTMRQIEKKPNSNKAQVFGILRLASGNVQGLYHPRDISRLLTETWWDLEIGAARRELIETEDEGSSVYILDKYPYGDPPRDAFVAVNGLQSGDYAFEKIDLVVGPFGDEADEFSPIDDQETEEILNIWTALMWAVRLNTDFTDVRRMFYDGGFGCIGDGCENTDFVREWTFALNNLDHDCWPTCITYYANWSCKKYGEKIIANDGAE